MKSLQIGPLRFGARPTRTRAQRALLRTANLARDRRDWPEAATLYRRYLDQVPSHAAIWVQYGHALKETDRLEDAEAAYRTALALQPQDADTSLQLGHALKLQQRWEDAEHAYRTAAELDETSADAHFELGFVRVMRGKLPEGFEAFRRSLRLVPDRSRMMAAAEQGLRLAYEDVTTPVAATGCACLELTDLIACFRDGSTISGIQRVQLGLLNYLVRHPAQAVVVFWEAGLLWSLDLEAVRPALRVYDAPPETRRAITDRMLAAAIPVRLRAVDTLVVTGAFWVRDDPGADHAKVKRDGARIAATIYDFIPLSTPDLCHPYLTLRFAQVMSELLLQMDYGFAISDYVAGEFRRLRAEAGYPAVPIETVKMAHIPDPAVLDQPPIWDDSIAELEDQRFVLCVGSISAHKNQVHAYQAWRLLVERGVDVPILVLVGKVWFGVDDLTSQIRLSHGLGGKVRVLEGLGDAAIATLYRACLFTIFPSLTEGWGLPVGESLAFGKVCLASGTTSIPEVGGEFALTIDPHNPRATAELVERLLANDELLAKEQSIRSGFKARSWDEVSEAYFAAVARAVAAPRAPAPHLGPGRMLRPRSGPATWPYGRALPKLDDILPIAIARFACTRGWHPVEAWGRWMDGAVAGMALPTDQPAGAPVRVVLQCRAAPWPRRNQLTVTAQDGSTVVADAPRGTDFLVVLDCAAGQDGYVDLELLVSGPLAAPAGERRRIGVGLRRALFVALQADPGLLPASRAPAASPIPMAAPKGGRAVHGRDAMIEAARRQSVLVSGWHHPDSIGASMHGQSATLSIATDATPQDSLDVILILQVDGRGAGHLTLQAGDAQARSISLPSGQRQSVLARAPATADAGGRVRVTLTLDRSVERLVLTAIAWLRPGTADEATLAQALLSDAAERSAADTELLARDMGFTVAGHLKGSYSLAAVNRRLALALDDASPGRVHVLQVEGEPRPEPQGLTGRHAPRLAAMARRPLTGTGPEVIISQHWPVWPPPPVGDITLAYVFWEESVVPATVITALNAGFDGVLVPARSVGKALVESGLRIPIRHIGYAPDLTAYLELGRTRPPMPPASASRPFTFLHVSSCFPRKGVDLLLAAYARAFTAADPVRLVIKGFPNPHNDVADRLARLRATTPDLAPVELIDADLTERRLLDLYAAADAMVLPTRGEGFNIPAAEAMAAGVPLIVTGFGGQEDFTDDGTARRLRFRLTPSRSHVRSSGSVWAEPDLEDLAAAMRQATHQRRAAPPQARRMAEQVGDPAAWTARIRDAATELLAMDKVSPPRVTWISSWKVRCGIAEYSRMLLEHYPHAARDVRVLCDLRTSDDDARAATPAAVPTWRTTPFSLGELAEAVEESGAPVVVLQHQPGLIRWPDLATLLNDRALRDRQVVVTLHNTRSLFDEESAASQARVVAALGHVRRVLVHTVADLERLHARGLLDNVALFPHGTLPSGLPPRRATRFSPDDAVLLGAYGFLLPHKGFLRLIEAFAEVHRTYPGARLRMVTSVFSDAESSGELARCRALARTLKLEDAIEWHLDYLENEDSLALLNECDLIVLPYQHTPESASGAARNAIAGRAPVVVTPIAIFDDLEDAVGRLPGLDADDIASGVLRLLDDPEGREAITRRAGTWLEQNSWGNMATRLGGMLHGLLASPTA